MPRKGRRLPSGRRTARLAGRDPQPGAADTADGAAVAVLAAQNQPPDTGATGRGTAPTSERHARQGGACRAGEQAETAHVRGAAVGRLIALQRRALAGRARALTAGRQGTRRSHAQAALLRRGGAQGGGPTQQEAGSRRQLEPADSPAAPATSTRTGVRGHRRVEVRSSAADGPQGQNSRRQQQGQGSLPPARRAWELRSLGRSSHGSGAQGTESTRQAAFQKHLTS
jgi:hypothetical protein